MIKPLDIFKLNAHFFYLLYYSSKPMDNTPDGVNIEEFSALNYDDTVAYEEQLPSENEVAASLAKRIGTSKVYLLSESSAATRAGKVRR